LTNWDYRWEFSGGGSINVEFYLKGFKKRTEGHYEIDYWHVKYGDGAILLNNKFENIGKVLKPQPFTSNLEIKGDFPGLMVQTTNDIGQANEAHTRYILKWETLNRNRDRARPKPWPGPSPLFLYKLKKTK
jgi:hypothetical protein